MYGSWKTKKQTNNCEHHARNVRKRPGNNTVNVIMASDKFRAQQHLECQGQTWSHEGYCRIGKDVGKNHPSV